jgi:hypothetical protein
MLNAPGRLPMAPLAERLGLHGTWSCRHHTIRGINRIPPPVDKM